MAFLASSVRKKRRAEEEDLGHLCNLVKASDQRVRRCRSARTNSELFVNDLVQSRLI